MVRAISSALSLALMILVLRLALPEVADLVTQILLKVLTILNHGLDLTITSTSSL